MSKERTGVLEKCDCSPSEHGNWTPWHDLPDAAVHAPLLPFFMSDRYKVIIPQTRMCHRCMRKESRQVFICFLEQTEATRYAKAFNDMEGCMTHVRT